MWAVALRFHYYFISKIATTLIEGNQIQMLTNTAPQKSNGKNFGRTKPNMKLNQSHFFYIPRIYNWTKEKLVSFLEFYK